MALICVCKAPCKLTALQNRMSFLISELDKMTTLRRVKIFTIKAVQAPQTRRHYSTDIGVGVGNIKDTAAYRKEGKRKSTLETDNPPRSKHGGLSCFLLPPCLPSFVCCSYFSQHLSLTNTRYRIQSLRAPWSDAIRQGLQPYRGNLIECLRSLSFGGRNFCELNGKS